MADNIRVGVIGANPNGSWGTFAHLPALAALDGFETVAVSTAHLDSAQETAGKFGIPHAFDDARKLAEHPDVDVVSVCVRVPAHRELADIALAAGKHVYCEWPLGRDSDEAAGMQARAAQAGVVNMVGLQARQSPVLRYLRDLIADGAVGAVHAVGLDHSVPWAFPPVPSLDYLKTRSSGANFLTIPGGHSIDALCHFFGEFQSLSALMAQVKTDAEALFPAGADTPNQIRVQGVLRGGAIANLRLQGAPQFGAGIRLEVNGSKGDLLVTSTPGARGIQMSDLRLQRATGLGEFEDITVPEDYFGIPSQIRYNPPMNVALGYLALGRAIRNGQAVPDFAAAVARHATLDAVAASAAEGRAVSL